MLSGHRQARRRAGCLRISNLWRHGISLRDPSKTLDTWYMLD